MAEKKIKARSRYSIGEWYGRACEFFSAKQRRDQAKLHAGLTTIAGLDCPFQKNRICTKKGGVCSLRRYVQMDEGPVEGSGPLITTCPNRFLEDDTIFKWIGEEILQTKTPIILLVPRVLVPAEAISARSLKMLDKSVANLKKGLASAPIDLKAFLKA